MVDTTRANGSGRYARTIESPDSRSGVVYTPPQAGLDYVAIVEKEALPPTFSRLLFGPESEVVTRIDNATNRPDFYSYSAVSGEDDMLAFVEVGTVFGPVVVDIRLFVNDDIPRDGRSQERLENGVTRGSRLDIATDSDAFRFDGRAGFAYGLALEANARDLNTTIDGVVLLGRENTSGRIDAPLGGAITGMFLAEEDGDLLVTVGGLRADNDKLPVAHGYRVTLNASDTVGQGLEHAQALADGGRVGAAIDVVGDEDTFRIEAEAGASYEFSLAGFGSVSDSSRLLLSVGRNALGDVAAAENATEATLSFTAPSDETLFLNVAREAATPGGTAGQTGRYTLTVRSDELVFDGTVGADRMTANGKNNVMRGGAGADEMSGGGGGDRMFGQGGGDALNGGAGGDVLNGGAGRDALAGQGGRDALIGRGGNDALVGGGGRDDLSGGGGRDRLVGGGGRDDLSGGGGRDRLDGGGGVDELAGGRGRDVFVQSGGRDRVLDWKNGQDVFEISSGAGRFRALDLRQRGDDVLIDTRAGDFRVEDARVRQFDAGDFDFV